MINVPVNAVVHATGSMGLTAQGDIARPGGNVQSGNGGAGMVSLVAAAGNLSHGGARYSLPLHLSVVICPKRLFLHEE